ncbi:MAG: diguanylate cyclase [Chloroflexi bacterium]|nr:diguanylate cyclase [Chloroflexota bacterium]
MQPIRILVVEDENIVAKDLQTRLQRLGYAVPAIVATGEDAIQRAAELHPDLILMDIVLKGEMDGIQAAAEIFARFGTPVIFLTAYGDEDYVQRARDLQPLGYILKPFKERELHAVIQAGLYRRHIELQLKESEEKYRRIVETAQEGIWIVDAAGNTSFVNRKMAEMLGYSVEEMLGAPSRDLTDADGHAGLIAPAAPNEADGAEQREVKLRRKDGVNYLWALVAASPITDGGGNHTGTLAMVMDITDRKAADEQLRHARDALELRVQERTAALAKANEALQAVVVERKLMEKELEQASDRLKVWVAKLEQRNHEITLLNELGDLLQSCRAEPEAYEVIARFAQKLFPQVSGAINIISASRNYVESVAVWGVSSPQVFSPSDCWALRRGQAHVVNDLSIDPLCPLCHHLKTTTPVNYMCVPMAAQGEAIGVLHLSFESHTHHQTETDSALALAERKSLAIAMGEHIGLALANLNLRESLRNQAIHDLLTGLFNRRYMEETLERELRRAARRNAGVGTIMLDLDHFKNFNDAHGHAMGDRILHQVGVFLRQHARVEDIACRYGGEEFVVIMPETNLAVTVRRAEELRAGIRELSVQHLGEVLSGVTVSLGVAIFPEHGATAAEIIQSADAALYRAKHEGRDRVVVARPPSSVVDENSTPTKD